MHPIKRGVLVVLLSLGAIGGFSHGFARMAQCHGSCSAESGRDQFEEHVADVCTRAAQRVRDEEDRSASARQPAYGGWGGPQWGGPPPPQWGAPPPQYWHATRARRGSGRTGSTGRTRRAHRRMSHREGMADSIRRAAVPSRFRSPHALHSACPLIASPHDSRPPRR